MKDKNVAGILALFLGSFGVHRFYVGQVGLGILYIFLNVFFFFSFFLSLIDAIVFFSQDKDAFDLKYNKNLYKAVRKEKPDFDRNRPSRDRRTEQRQVARTEQRSARNTTSSKTAPRRPRHNPYKASGIEKYKDYDYDGAIDDFTKALEIDDRDIATHFNVACAYSLNEEVQQAFHHLDRAVTLGFNDFRKIKEHDAFAFLRIQPEFEAFEENKFQLKSTQTATEATAAPAENTELVEEELQLPNDLLEQLNKLNELKNKGLLTEEEFTVQKSKLLK
jgi:TM2 domain-containing membrane protein YozV